MERKTALEAMRLLEQIEALERLQDELPNIEAFDDVDKIVYEDIQNIVKIHLQKVERKLEEL